MPLQLNIFNVGNGNFITAIDENDLIVIDAGRQNTQGIEEVVVGENGAFRNLLKNNPQITNARFVITHHHDDHHRLLPGIINDIKGVNPHIKIDEFYIGGGSEGLPKNAKGWTAQYDDSLQRQYPYESASKPTLVDTLGNVAFNHGEPIGAVIIGNEIVEGKVVVKGRHNSIFPGISPTDGNYYSLVTRDKRSPKDISFRFGYSESELGQSKLTIISPKMFNSRATDENHRNIMAMITSQGRKILLTGDATLPLLSDVDERYRHLFMDIDVVVGPHHASGVTQPRHFYYETDPGKIIKEQFHNTVMRVKYQRNSSPENPLLIFSSDAKNPTGRDRYPQSLIDLSSDPSVKILRTKDLLGFGHSFQLNLGTDCTVVGKVDPMGTYEGVEHIIHQNPIKNGKFIKDLIGEARYSRTAAKMQRLVKLAYPELSQEYNQTIELLDHGNKPMDFSIPAYSGMDDAINDNPLTKNKIKRILQKHLAGFKSTFSTKQKIKQILENYFEKNNQKAFNIAVNQLKLKDFHVQKQQKNGEVALIKAELINKLKNANLNVTPPVRFRKKELGIERQSTSPILLDESSTEVTDLNTFKKETLDKFEKLTYQQKVKALSADKDIWKYVINTYQYDESEDDNKILERFSNNPDKVVANDERAGQEFFFKLNKLIDHVISNSYYKPKKPSNYRRIPLENAEQSSRHLLPSRDIIAIGYKSITLSRH